MNLNKENWITVLLWKFDIVLNCWSLNDFGLVSLVAGSCDRGCGRMQLEQPCSRNIMNKTRYIHDIKKELDSISTPKIRNEKPSIDKQSLFVHLWHARWKVDLPQISYGDSFPSTVRCCEQRGERGGSHLPDILLFPLSRLFRISSYSEARAGCKILLNIFCSDIPNVCELYASACHMHCSYGEWILQLT